MKVTLRTYVILWLLLTFLLSYESAALNSIPELSILAALKHHAVIPASFSLSPAPGGTVSLCLGWTGFGLMVIAGTYSLRKRWAPLKSLGTMPGWLDFHIFCGLLGPTLILFHTNLRVGGLVGISFWAMAIVFASGIFGRYFYLQVLRQKSELDQDAEASEMALDRYQAENPERLSRERLSYLKGRVLELAGVPAGLEGNPRSGLARLYHSLIGDLRLRTGFRTLAPGQTRAARLELRKFGMARRRSHYLDYFCRIMGYWNAFHGPFAALMYIVAIIHIVSSMLFMVS